MKKATKKARTPKAPEMPKALLITEETKLTLKFQKWCEHFFDRNDKETYGNATKSALRVYNTESYNTASVIGHENLRKLKNLRLQIADAEGFGLGDMMRIGFQKVLTGDFDDWDRMMVRLGYHEPDPKIVVNNTQNNFNFNNVQELIAQSRKERGLTP